MNSENEMVLNIEKISNLGFGIGRYNGKVIFVNGCCPQDKVKVRLIKNTKNYAKAEILEILEPSPYRVKPTCPLQKVCGACQLQFMDYNYQLEIKKQIVEDAMHQIEGRDFEIREVVPSPKQWECRRKIQYSVAQSKNSKNLKIGYYKNKSHEVINIKYCPIQPKICDEIAAYIRENGQKFGITGYDEKANAGMLKHIVMRSSVETGKLLLTFVINAKSSSENLVNFAKNVYEEFSEVSGIWVNFNTLKTNLILTKNSKCICGDDFLIERICDIKFQIGSNTFFQVNPKSAENIFKFIKNHISQEFKTPTILDAYAGITAFGFVLADISKLVVSVEECFESVELAHRVKEMNGITNVELNHKDAGEFFQQESRKFDIVILDPPRKGCSRESLEYAKRMAKSQIIYVSCNPITLARDLNIMINMGAKVRYIQPFDMFCHTYHVECVAVIDVVGE